MAARKYNYLLIYTAKKFQNLKYKINGLVVKAFIITILKQELNF